MKKYDVFISYAVEDKHTVAAPVARALQQNKLRVYFVGERLETGDLIDDTVHEGLENSSYFVLVLSENYTRRWTIVEWTNILRLEKRTGRKLIFPVWHGLTMVDVIRKFPELSNHFALSTEDGVEVILPRLVAKIKKQKAEDVYRRALRAGAILIAVTALLFGVLWFPESQPEPKVVALPSVADAEEVIRSRINAYQQKVDAELIPLQMQPGARSISIDSVHALYNAYHGISQSSRNDYHLSSGYARITGHDNIEATGITLANTPHTAYGVLSPVIWCLDVHETDSTCHVSLAFTDTTETGFRIDTMYMDASAQTVHLWVSYDRYLRCVYYTMDYSEADAKLRQHVRLLSLKPREEYSIVNESGIWKLQTVQ